MNSLNKQQGFSLIELLVSVVIFSVGLLSIAGLQMVSKTANYESLQRTTAAHIAYGLLEEMRTNGSGMGAYLASPDLGGGTMGTAPASYCQSAVTPCDAMEKAALDLWFWESALDGVRETGAQGSAGGVMSPTMCINGPVGGAAGIYVVSVAWRGSAALTNPVIDPCGAGTGKYGSANEYRRVLQVATFIDPNI